MLQGILRVGDPVMFQRHEAQVEVMALESKGTLRSKTSFLRCAHVIMKALNMDRRRTQRQP